MSTVQQILKKVTEKPSFEESTENEFASDECQQMVAEAAYYRAEKRGFALGDEQADWLEAEQEVKAKLAG